MSDRPQIMGILNVTPDSFSDGGRHDRVDAAVEHARQMLAQGADVIDVGGESTRPGAKRIDIDEQIRRTADVVERVAALGATISIDTTRSAVAQAALDRGATIINDVSAGREDEAMFELAAKRGVTIILMHMLGDPATMQAHPRYDDVVGEIEAFLLERAAAAETAGIARERIMIDPGIGFGKTREHNLKLMANLGRFVATDYPVLLGASRKRFMGSICTPPAPGSDPPIPTQLVGATCAATALGVAAGVAMVRVHDVRANRQAADVAWAIARS
jgi:dihydropteroate synthase